MAENQNDELPWNWIGFQGSGQRCMTQTQFDWLKAHNMTRDEYMKKVHERKS